MNKSIKLADIETNQPSLEDRPIILSQKVTQEETVTLRQKQQQLESHLVEKDRIDELIKKTKEDIAFIEKELKKSEKGKDEG